jgi:hypothetical protein
VAKNQHTFAKRQRELAKKQKAEEKRMKRQKSTRPDDSDGASAAPEQQPDPGR